MSSDSTETRARRRGGATTPASDIDLFTRDALLNPYPLYEDLRARGPAVWLTALGVFAIARDAEVRTVGRDADAFSSAHGVMLNDIVNNALGGKAVICSDAPRHTDMRRIIRRPLAPKAVGDLAAVLGEEARALVARLVEAREFDAVTDLAQHLPLTIVSKLVGVPESGRRQMLEWAAATFEASGPDNPTTRSAFPKLMEMLRYGNDEAVPPHLRSGGWAQAVYDAAERGEIDRSLCPSAMSAYLAPSLDTTINAIGSAMLLFGEDPKQWDLIRENPKLIPNAVNEVLRLESPIQRFSRVATRDYDLDGVTIGEGDRVMLLFGSANRDDRRWEDPAHFDVQRPRVAEHVAFGFGPHACVGSHLARLEIRALLEALTARVQRFEVAAPVRSTNQVLRGLTSMRVEITR